MRLKSLRGVVIGFAAVLWMGGIKAAEQQASSGPGLEQLLGRLQSNNSGVRMEALSYIGAMQPYAQEIAPHVIHSLQDPLFRVRANAANALGNLQNSLPALGTQFPEAIPQLIRMLSDRDPDDEFQLVRRFAAYALQHLGPPAKAALPELLKIATNATDVASVRSEAVRGLGEIGQATPEVVAALIQLLDDPARINENYPTIGNTAYASLGGLGAKAEAARPTLMERLGRADATQREAAASALGTVGAGSLETEQALLELLNDTNADVQKAALASLEGINESYFFFFRQNVVSDEISQQRQLRLAELRGDAARRSRFVKLLAAQVRLERRQSFRVEAVRLLLEWNAREYLPLFRAQFARSDEKSFAVESPNLRIQLLRAVAAWLPDPETVAFLAAVDSDANEAPQVRFGAVVLLCERGDAPAIAYILQQHLDAARRVAPLASLEALQKSLLDRPSYGSEQEFNGRKPVSPAELSLIQSGIQLAQHFYAMRQRGVIRELYLSKIGLHEGQLDSLRFRITTPSPGWSFELRKKGDWWLPGNFGTQ